MALFHLSSHDILPTQVFQDRGDSIAAMLGVKDFNYLSAT